MGKERKSEDEKKRMSRMTEDVVERKGRRRELRIRMEWESGRRRER